MHQALLDFIGLHVTKDGTSLPCDEEFKLFFHVLDALPALRDMVRSLMTKLCEQRIARDTSVFGGVLEGTLLENNLSRKAVLTAISTSISEPIPINSNAKALVWISVHDIDEDNAEIGQYIWNSLECSLESSILDVLLAYCSHSSHSVRKSAAAALGDACNILKNDNQKVAINTLSAVTQSLYALNSLDARLGCADALIHLAPTLNSSEVSIALDFLLSTGFLDSDMSVRSAMTSAGVAIIDAGGSDSAEVLLPIFEKYLEKSSDKGLSEAEYDSVRLGAVVCLGATAQHLDPSNPKVIAIMDTLIEVLKTPSESVQRSVSDRISPLIKSIATVNKDFVEKLVSSLLQNCLSGQSYGDRRGAAFGISGIVKGLGLSSLKSYGIMEALRTGVENKKDAVAREGTPSSFITSFIAF